MRRSPNRLVLIVIVFIAALGGALLVLQSRPGDDSTPAKDDSAAASSDIWKVGDTWTVKVRQDAGAITPGGESSIASIPFRFQVTDAPKGDDRSWVVQVKQDGAEGPFAAGWRLEYRPKGDKLVLHRVAVGTEPPLEAALAGIVLGPQFPYETSYSAPPKDSTIDAKRLLARSSLPPTALPGSDDAASGATPPAEAPKLDAGGAPEGAPEMRG